jgi:NAD(P)-dependent dehydrogenase (short-subunit alcohol dehydrogenase family)
MSGNGQRVAIVTGGSQGIGAGVVAAYRGRGWAVVANALTIKPSRDPDVLTVKGESRCQPPPTGSWAGRSRGSGLSIP